MATAARTTRKPAALARLFAHDPMQAVITVLRDAGPDTQLRAEEVKQALRLRGVPAADLALWRRLQARLVAHPEVGVGGDRYRRTYRYVPPPPAATASVSPASAAEEALTLLAGHRLPSARRAELVQVVREALTARPAERAADQAADPALVARLEQREKDAVRALVDLAIAVEELATNQASARALVHVVRSRTRGAQLEPVERAGETTHFDRARHQSVGGPIADGAAVVVVRPGYTWNGPHGRILVSRAVVQDRSEH